MQSIPLTQNPGHVYSQDIRYWLIPLLQGLTPITLRSPSIRSRPSTCSSWKGKGMLAAFPQNFHHSGPLIYIICIFFLFRPLDTLKQEMMYKDIKTYKILDMNRGARPRLGFQESLPEHYPRMGLPRDLEGEHLEEI